MWVGINSPEMFFFLISSSWCSGCGVDVSLGGINLDKSRAQESRVYPGIEITRLHPPSSHSGDQERTDCDWLRPRPLISDWPRAWDHRSHLIRLINTTPSTLHRLHGNIRGVRETNMFQEARIQEEFKHGDFNQKSIYFLRKFYVKVKSIMITECKKITYSNF